MTKQVWAYGAGEKRRACGQKRYGFGYYAIWSNKQGREPADIHVVRCKATQTFDMTFRCICMVGVPASPPRPPSTPLKPPGPPSTPRRSPTPPVRSRRPPRPPPRSRRPPRPPLCLSILQLFVCACACACSLSPKVKSSQVKPQVKPQVRAVSSSQAISYKNPAVIEYSIQPTKLTVRCSCRPWLLLQFQLSALALLCLLVVFVPQNVCLVCSAVWPRTSFVRVFPLRCEASTSGFFFSRHSPAFGNSPAPASHFRAKSSKQKREEERRRIGRLTLLHASVVKYFPVSCLC